MKGLTMITAPMMYIYMCKIPITASMWAMQSQ